MLEGLNDRQKQAVTAGQGPVVIVAGPGTGKTKTLTARIAYLVGQGVGPERILALTFTVKAAQEMAERLAKVLPDGSRPLICTFHSLGHRIIKAGERLNFISEAERLSVIRELHDSRTWAPHHELKSLSTRELSLLISQYKGMVATESETVAGLVAAYQAALTEKKMHDYDDLLYLSYQKLNQHPKDRQSWQSRFEYILVDEFQDTSELQWELLKLICGTDNLLVIGDPKQSIYGFRGASGDAFGKFRQDFPKHQEITLKTNYRSSVSIVNLASAIFGGQHSLEPYSSDVGEVAVHQTLNEFSEADLALKLIEQGIGGSDLLKATAVDGGRRFNDFAVLYRTHRVAKTLQRRLQDSGIPFQTVGEGSPYEQPEVQAIIGVMRWLQSGGEPPKIQGFSAAQTKTLMDGLDKQTPASKLAHDIALSFNLADKPSKKQALGLFTAVMVRFDRLGLGTALEYIDRIAQEDFYDSRAEAVTLMTIHASKGLEFNHVVLIAAEEGILPHIRKRSETDFDEEKRLFYVAVTRAKQRLDILHAKKRGGQPAKVSRFVASLDQSVLSRCIDPDMQKIERKQQRRQQKARQATLF